MDMRVPPKGLLSFSCVSVRDETASIKTYRLRAGSGRVPVIAGQALVVKVPLPSGPVWRSFTVSGSRDGDLELTIKAQSEGGATRWLHDNFISGCQVDARAPRGDFTLELRQQPELAFVSGGSGATPMMAMLRELAEAEPQADVAWFHAAHDPDEMLFAAELTGLQRIMPRLTVAVTVSRAAPGWFGYRGRLNRRLVASAMPDFGRREVFCCGPQGFMQETQLVHAAEGGASSRFHTESFGGGTGPVAVPVPASPVGVPGPSFQLRVNGRTLAAAPDETLLQASLRQGVVIPCGCGEGRCGTCMVRLISGDITASPNGGITPEEAESGYVLACSSRATSDVEISLN